MTGVLAARRKPPNVVLILCDNLGYGDVGCYGARDIRTPHVDRLAAEGLRFTDCYAASGVCTPSRAALLTGCYPRRVGLDRTDPDGFVLRPKSPNGLHPDEVTIAEVLKGRGYATGMIGKWHLGDHPDFLPIRQGFDEWYGMPMSDDMKPFTLMENDRVVEEPTDRETLTQRYTRRAVDFIERNRARPFFLYLPHAMPGSTPRPFASEAFQGRSARGPWGDAVEEIDWSTGEIVAALRRLGLERDTLVIWTNDNGAPRNDGRNGTNRPLGGWGYTIAEGGQRVPCIAWWPATVPAGRTAGEVITLMDWLPTVAKLAGAKLGRARTIDGRDIGPLLRGAVGARSPHEAFFYYYGPQLQAVRRGRWKLVLPLAERMVNLQGKTSPGAAALYDLETDVGETANRHAEQPGVVRELTALAEKARAELGDVGRRGRGQRAAGRR